MSQTLSDSRRANLAADAITRAFRNYRCHVDDVTEHAPSRFAQRDWLGAQADVNRRLHLYHDNVQVALRQVRDILADKQQDKMLWVGLKAVYSSHSQQRDDWEIAESFFNSVARRVFTTVGVDQQVEFVASDFHLPPTSQRLSLYHHYQDMPDAHSLLHHLFEDYAFAAPFADKEADISFAATVLEQQLTEAGVGGQPLTADMAKVVFYRGKGAYIVGELRCGELCTPLILALLHPPEGIRIDAVLTDERDAHILFSFTRSFFRVITPRPHDLVDFLARIMPRKQRAELYIALGFNKHGKTEMYRALLEHLEHSQEQFCVAPGQRGMVMAVFAMPGHDQVFKIIKDYFEPPKTTSRHQVMRQYNLVFQHDRAGRLIDAQEFEFLAFHRRHFSAALLEELLEVAANTVRLEGDNVIIDHVYIERRITPLDIYVRQASRQEAEAAIIDYGHAIKDLARSNIFPGDMLLKNFGVTRHGRVVFYDYDELVFLSECNFRRFPEAQTPEQEMASEPWYYVADNDIFPEELLRFLGIPNPLKPVFTAHHNDLLDVVFWHHMQASIAQGVIADILPYGQQQRLQQARVLL